MLTGIKAPKKMLAAIRAAIERIQDNGYDFAFNLNKGTYEVVAQDSTQTVYQEFDDYQKIIDYAETLPKRRFFGVKINLN